MKAKVGQELAAHSAPIGGMAAIMWLFNEVGSIEGLEPIQQAVLKIVIFVLAAALVVLLRRMKPPAAQPPKPQARPPGA